MNTTLDHVAPEIVQAIVAQATARGLSVNDYLRHLLELNNSEDAELAHTDAYEERQPRNEAMFAVLQRSMERLKNMPFSGSTQDSLKILHEGRAGGMYGYEPTE
ncbi:MAG: hypothetical protein ACRD63_01555 [Pyrinomonadaceae bacterium]